MAAPSAKPATTSLAQCASTAIRVSESAIATVRSNRRGVFGSKPAAEATVLGCAQQRKEALVKAGKIDAPWQAIKHDKVEAVDGKKGKEWKVTFKDPAAKDKAKETLYIFFTAPGNFIAANFTGQ